MNAKHIAIYVICSILALAAATGIFIYIRDVKMAEGTVKYNMYYINGSSNTLAIESRTVNLVDSDDIMFKTVVDEFKSGPKTANTSLVLPAEFKIISRTFAGNTANIDIEPSFNSLSSADRVLCVGALVYTLTDMSFIDNVKLTINGTPFISKEDGEAELLNRTNVRNNPEVVPEKTQQRMVTLYFVDRTGSRLVPEQRNIEEKQSLTLEYQIVEQLISGPDKNMLTPTMPKNTLIRDIKTEDGICYVNLSKGFLTKTPVSTELTIYSVVNSLTELKTVNKVQFLIEGEKVNKLENIDFSKTFERNEAVIR